jgi:CubicO group peptidase (beta-lactamase class C family)
MIAEYFKDMQNFLSLNFSKTLRMMLSAFFYIFFLSPVTFAQNNENKVNELIPVDARTIEKLVESQISGGNFVGSSIAVMHRGKIIFSKGYGKRSLVSGKPVDAETIFNIGSVSKQFTSAAIFLLAAEGKLSVDDKVAKYFPLLTKADQITLLDLMQHVSGYADYYPLDFPDRRILTPILPEKIIDAHATQNLDFEPKTQYSYSNTNYVILGRVVEKVSEKPLDRFFAERFFKPLKMKNTCFEPLKRDARFADGFTSYALGEPEIAPHENRGWGAGAGGVFSTATDLAKWDLALMEGKVLKPEALKLMTTRLKLSDGSERDYGAGVEIHDMAGDTIITHGGSTSGFTARNTMVPSTKSAIVILSNTDFSLPGAILHGKFLRSLIAPKPVNKKNAAGKTSPPIKREIPQVKGFSAAETAKSFFSQMQAGNLDRSLLGEEFSFFLNEDRLRKAAASLKPFGNPTDVEILDQSERGGMEASSIQFIFPSGKLNGFMYRSTDGKIQGFSIRK